MASTTADAPTRTGGLMGLLIPVVVLTILAVGAGFMIGTTIVAAHKAAAAAAPAAPATAALPPPSTVLKELAPIVTNLASPDNASWIRLQAAVVYDKTDAPQIEVLAAKIGDDVLTVLRTMTLDQLQGGSGLELLREDLNERAAIRSDGHIKELIIEMLVIQ